MKILLTTTSFQDTPGPHHDVLANSGHQIIRARGPLTEAQMLELIKANDGFDALLNGDDAITAKVIDAALAAKTPLKVVSKYGIGLDSIDVKYATSKRIAVLNTPGVNHTTVAEHTIMLMIAIAKHLWPHLLDQERRVEAHHGQRAVRQDHRGAGRRPDRQGGHQARVPRLR